MQNPERGKSRFYKLWNYVGNTSANGNICNFQGGSFNTASGNDNTFCATYNSYVRRKKACFQN